MLLKWAAGVVHTDARFRDDRKRNPLDHTSAHVPNRPLIRRVENLDPIRAIRHVNAPTEQCRQYSPVNRHVRQKRINIHDLQTEKLIVIVYSGE